MDIIDYDRNLSVPQKPRKQYSSPDECLKEEMGAIQEFFVRKNAYLTSYGPAVNALIVRKDKEGFSLSVHCDRTACHAANNGSDALKTARYYIQSLQEAKEVSYDDANAFWSYYFDRDDRVFKNLVGPGCRNIQYVLDKKGRRIAIVIKVDSETDFFLLHTAVVLTRTPLERPGCIAIYKAGITNGLSEDEARFLAQHVMLAGSPNPFPVFTPYAHFPFPCLGLTFDTFINGKADSGKRFGDSYHGVYRHFGIKAEGSENYFVWQTIFARFMMERERASNTTRSKFDRSWTTGLQLTTFECLSNCEKDPRRMLDTINAYHRYLEEKNAKK